MKKELITGLGVVALAVTLSACGGSSGSSSSSSSTSTPSASMSSPTASSSESSSSSSTGMAELKTASSSMGVRVVGANGKSVYFFTKDVKDSGKSACTGACATTWPPVTTTSTMPAVDGVSGTIGTIPTADGKMQITINGMPIYFYSKDEDSGDTYGQGVLGIWFLVSPSGSMMTATTSSSPSSY